MTKPYDLEERVAKLERSRIRIGVWLLALWLVTVMFVVLMALEIRRINRDLHYLPEMIGRAIGN